MSAGKVPSDLKRISRSGARLAAVQALYQLEQAGQSAKAVIRDFMEDRLGMGPEGVPIEEADPDLFKAIVNGVIDDQSRIDKAVSARLAKGWKLERLNATSRAIFRAAASELLDTPNVTAVTIIDEYVGVAHAFFDNKEAAFVNGVLDSLASDLRKGELSGEDPFAGV